MSCIWYFSGSMLLGALLSALCYFALTRWKILDMPNQRSSHQTPVVRGGGLAISIVILSYFFFDSWHIKNPSLIVAFSSLMLLSLIDDIRGLSSKLKLLAHALIILLFVLSLDQMNSQSNSSVLADLGVPQVILYLLGFMWILGFTNIFNFMDGINGLAASQSIVTGLGGVLICSFAGIFDDALLCLSLVVAGATLGFLPFNFPHARMFLGDVGSIPLGFCLGFLALVIPLTFGLKLLLPLLLLQSNFLLDSSITLIRRFWRGDSILEAHREHFYQKLVQSGKSHGFVTGMQICLQLFCLFLAVLCIEASPVGKLFLSLIVVLNWILFFLYSEKRFGRYQGTPLNA